MLKGLADAARTPYWLDRADRPEPCEPLPATTSADLAVVGGGFTGLWTALRAKERDPSLDVVLLEARRVGWAATGRNGGFCMATLTHGLDNGLSRWPAELAVLHRLGMENLDGIERAVARYGIECAFERTGELHVATAPWQLDGLRETAEVARVLGARFEELDRDAVRAEIDSPTYAGGYWERDACAMLDPARLAWGLREACRALGVRVHERTPVRSITRTRTGLALATRHGTVRAARAVLGTGAFPPLLRRLGLFVVPVYDYALVTEPLSAADLAAVGWANRQGVGDSGNLFHYYRLTADDRILWGGYDAVYYNGGRIRPEHDQRDATFTTLARHFYATFPQLAHLRFTHRWGGIIDTCTRFSAFYGRAHGGRLAYTAGYTGAGVGPSRFAADVLLDLLDGAETERTRLRMVREKPVPFPPEPLRSGVIQLTRRSIARADAREGRRDLWLRTLDRLGLGFDS